MSERSAEIADWIAEARGVPIEQPLARAGVRLRRVGAESAGPCPVCGGRDRFSINHRKQVFFCRRSGAGGDAIALTRYLEACDFFVAVEILTGRPAPSRTGETAEARAARREALAKRAAERARRSERQEAEAERFRERERRRAWEMWGAAGAVAGSAAEAYLAKRGLVVPDHAFLRCAPDLPLFGSGRQPVVVHRGPALLAPIVGPAGQFSALHATWIDLAQADGKARVADPETGELLPAKKVRGSARCGHIPLVLHPAPRSLVLGEGIETVLSVWRALRTTAWPFLPEAAFWAGYSLDNIAGPATGTAPHPTLRLPDAAGRMRAPRVKGEVPDLERPGLPIPDSVARVWLLGDGDSDGSRRRRR